MQLADAEPGQAGSRVLLLLTGSPTNSALRSGVRRSAVQQVGCQLQDSPDQISEALQAILAEKQFLGRVNHPRESRTNRRRARSSTGSRKSASGSQYRISRSFARADGSAGNRCLPPHRSRIRARCSGRGRKVAAPGVPAARTSEGHVQSGQARVVPQPSPATDAQGPAELQGDVILPVQTGKRDSTSGVDWIGNRPSRSASCASPTPLHRPAGDAVRLLRDIDKRYLL